MDEKERQIRKRLRDDFRHYASRCLKIRTKEGDIKPFILNKAQNYIHERIEYQKLATGKVRAIIVKGRQQGCCFSEQMKVLTADYRWVRIADIQIGDRVVACDEEARGVTKADRKCGRKMRTAIVEDKREFVKEAYEVLFDNGARLEVTSDHRMLCRKRGGTDLQWREVGTFRIGDVVRVVTRPPNYECQTYEDGWLAGMIDGEGSARLSGSKRISISQVNNNSLLRIKNYFRDIGMPFKEVIDNRKAGEKSKLGNKPVHRIDIHRMGYFIELFARCRPMRFTCDEWHVGHDLPGKAVTDEDDLRPWAKVISIRSLGEMKVVDLQTSEKTFICEGLVSHNSTYIEGRFYWLVTHRFGCRAFILTHDRDATNNLFEMAQRYHEYCPPVLRPDVEASNAKELIFGSLDSGYKLGTAGNKAVGRSSTIQFLHGSETAYWPNAAEHAKGILQAVPNSPGTEILIESTANGLGNYFHEQWQMAESGESDFIPIFVPWYWQPEYQREPSEEFSLTDEEHELIHLYNLTIPQLYWRRLKIAELSVGGLDGIKAFAQEYPNTSTESFQTTGDDSFITPDIVMRARKCIVGDSHGSLIIGVDPARYGNDRTSIIRRRGRVAYGLASYVKKDTMEVVGIIHRMIIDESPDRVCLDIGGLGVGIYDRLVELGHKHILVPFNGGSIPLDGKRYFNRRAEVWGLMKEWLADQPAQIPDSDSLHADLCGLRYRFDSNTRLVLEKKEDAKKRGIRSPDEADCLSLTFSVPEQAVVKNKENRYSEVSRSLFQSQQQMDRLKKAAYTK